MTEKRLTTYIHPLHLFGNDEGKNSTSFIGEDEQLKTNFFVKEMPKKKYSSSSEYYKEAIIQHQCHHPHIAQIQYAAETDDMIYYLLTLYEKGSINSLIKTKGLPRQKIIKYSLEFLSGLHFMHTKRILHFDIKPTNILLSDEGSAILTDFGTSGYMNTMGLAEVNSLYIKHLPPEILQGLINNNFSGLGDVTVDIYQTGITLYRLCVGNEQFNQLFPSSKSKQETLYRIKAKKLPDLSLIPTKLNPLKPIISKCTAFKPEYRYSSVMEIIHDLSALS